MKYPAAAKNAALSMTRNATASQLPKCKARGGLPGPIMLESHQPALASTIPVKAPARMAKRAAFSALLLEARTPTPQ